MKYEGTLIIYCKELSPTEKLVYSFLCEIRTEKEGSGISYEEISDRINISRSTAIRTVRSLTEKGFISVTKGKDKLGRTEYNRYAIKHLENRQQIIGHV